MQTKAFNCREKLSRPTSANFRLFKQIVLAMKLTIFFLIIGLSCVQAKSFSQTVTFSGKAVPMDKIFTVVERQTNYVFIYDGSILSDAAPVSVTANKMSLDEFLKTTFREQPLEYTIENKTIVISRKRLTRPLETSMQPMFAIDVKGRVVNENGDPVPDVTVNVKNSSAITITNQDGEFSLSGVEQNAILIFTHASMETFELKVSGKTELTIRLKTKVAVLSEVQVASTGYQQVKPNEIAGSLVVVDNKALSQQVGMNILNRLDGVTSGIIFDKSKYNNRVGSKLNIAIRGLSTINGPLDPLVVLDGFIYEGDINNINPNDIESITILKDAAATSIWGARAGNGVIVITSKRGRFNQKSAVEFNVSTTISEKPDLSYLPQMSSGDYIDVEQFLFGKGYFNNRINVKYIPLTPAVQIFLARRNGTITSADSASRIDALKKIDVRDQYLKYFYTNSVIQQYSANLTGGSSNNAYTLSFGYDKNKGETYTQLDRFNLRMENTFRPTKNLDVTAGVYFTKTENKSGRSGYNTISINNRVIPYLQFADNDGNPVPVSRFYNTAYVSTLAGGKLLDWSYYPLEDYKHSYSTRNLQDIYAVGGLKYSFIKSLNLDLKYQYESQQADLVQLDDADSYKARETTNLFTQYTAANNSIKYIVPIGGIRTTASTKTQSYTFRGQLNFKKSWGDHDFAAIAGGEIRQVNTTVGNGIQYGYKADPMSSTNVDFVSYYQTIVNGGFSQVPAILTSTETNFRFASFYTNGSYTYRKKYIFSASARKDGSNVFGANTNDKWKPLWSTGFGWLLSDEQFYTASWMPKLKLKISYGANGNIDITKSALAVARYFPNAPDTRFPYGRIQYVNNPDLRWEKVKTINVGVEFSSAKDIVSGSVEFYQKKGSDLYGLAPIDYTGTGRDLTIKNVAAMKGTGIDMAITTRNINKRLKWNTTLLFNYSSDKTTGYYEPEPVPLTAKLGGGMAISPVIGKPLYSIAAWKWGGLDNNGNPQGYIDGHKSADYDSLASFAEIVYVGSTTPAVFGSVINTVSYKKFSLSVNVMYKLGYYFQKSSITYASLISGIGYADYAKRWQQPGDENRTNVPSFVYPANSVRDDIYVNSEINVLKADHIRLQYINLDYRIDRIKNLRLPFREIQLYGNISNLGILWRANKEHLDPDYPSSIRPEKTFAFGIRGLF